nr:PepSY domain-containing protein [Accumulibacter sp.]
MRTVLERVEREYPGHVIDVELEREHENKLEPWVSRIKFLRSGSGLVKLKVDARTGAVIESEERSGAETERGPRLVIGEAERAADAHTDC